MVNYSFRNHDFFGHHLNKFNLIFSLDVNVSPNEETVWLNRIELSMLFDRDVKTIGKHINNILKEEYMNVTGVIAKIATT